MLTRRQHPNGLQVLTHPIKDSKSVTVLILYRVGSRYESRDINGVSHFVEHLMFKGTKNRPSTLDIVKELDGVGAAYNAFTGKDITGYYIKLSADKLDLALDILSDMLFNSLFQTKEIQRERQVVIEEINMREDNPMMHIGTLFEQQMWGNQPLGWDIAGPRKVINNVTRAKIIKYRNDYYKPSNMVISVAGGLPRDIQARIAKKFVRTKRKEAFPVFAPLEDKQGSKKILLRKKDVGQVQFAMGVKAYEYEHKLLPALNLLSVILGGNMSSRLFINIRERKGLAYFVRASSTSYEDTGAFAIQAGLDRRRLPLAIEAIMEELLDVKENGFTDEELQKGKEYLKGHMTLEWEDSENIAEWYGRQQLLMGKTKTPEEKLDEIMKVTHDDIAKVACELFNPKKMRGVLIGPLTDVKPLEKLIKF